MITGEDISDVEKLMDNFVLEIKGELGRTLIPNTHNQPNADYVFKTAQVIAELKCFQKDLFSALEDEEKNHRLIDRWVTQGVFNDEKLVKQMLLSRQLPKECGRDLVRSARTTVDNAVRQANKQIRETKGHLKMPNAKALLLICKDGNYFMDTMPFMYLIAEVVFNKYTEIDGLIFFTINQGLISEDGSRAQQVFFPLFKEKDIRFMNFVEEFRMSFLKTYLPKVMGASTELIDSSGNELDGFQKVAKLKYLPKSITYKSRIEK